MPSLPAPPPDRTIPAVLYAAKSTVDEHGSISTQLADCRAAAEHQGREIIEPTYQDEAASAYKGSRGAGLSAAMEHAEQLVGERGACELWVQHSDRLARGDAITAAHLIEYALRARKSGMRLRSVQDDTTFGDLIHTVLMGERNHEDSRRKSEAVRSGLERGWQRGQRGGGPVPDGYELLVQRDEGDRVVSRSYRLDPERAPIIGLAFDLSARGMGDPSIAQELNRYGHRTKRGRPWSRRRVQDLLTNPFYAGRVVRYRNNPTRPEQVREGQHPALIEPELFDRLLEARDARDKAKGSARRPEVGRPVTNFALAKLARCYFCGGLLAGRVSTYKRKDGSRKREYRCPASHDGSADCSATWGYDAEVIDRAVIANLEHFLGDFEGWREQIEKGQAAERRRLMRNAQSAAERLSRLRDLCGKIEADYERYVKLGAEAEAATVLSILTRRQKDQEDAQRAHRAAEEAAASVPEDAPADAMLDFYNALGAAVRGRIDGADTLLQVNAALRDLFERFVLERTDEGTVVLPVLGPDAFTYITSRLDVWPYPVTAKVGEYDAQVNSDGTLRVTMPAGAPYPETAVIEYDGPNRIIATGEEKIIPPLRRIEATLKESCVTPTSTA